MKNIKIYYNYYYDEDIPLGIISLELTRQGNLKIFCFRKEQNMIMNMIYVGTTHSLKKMGT